MNKSKGDYVNYRNKFNSNSISIFNLVLIDYHFTIFCHRPRGECLAAKKYIIKSIGKGKITRFIGAILTVGSRQLLRADERQRA